MLDQALQAVPRVRRTDPGTSYQAAFEANGLANDHCQRILDLLSVAKRPMGGTEIAERLGMTQVQVCRRLPELQRAGAIQVAPGEAKTPAGRPQRLWEMVDVS